MNAMETIMKRSIITKTLVIAAVTVLALGVAPKAKADDKGCSNVIVQGTFAYTGTGFIAAPSPAAGPFVEVGTQTFDGRGGTTYAATLSANGNIVQVTATGTYTVNPDCTGTMTLQVLPRNATVHIFFVIADGGSEIQAIETDPGLIITRVARRLFPGRAI
jgi:hypothetical protein